MKYLLVMLVVLLGVWLWRSGRQADVAERKDKPAQPPAPPQPQEMARCALCGVHLPKNDAVTGRQGLYCSTEHRQRAES